MVQKRVMIESQIKGRGVKDPKVIDAMSKVERHKFVLDQFQDEAYNDYPLPIEENQTISQPFIVAYMTEKLELKGDEKVLEIGTGSGYQAAVLAEIVREVYSVEIIESLAMSAEKLLDSLGYKNIHIKHGDGYQGWIEHAPYDAIIVTAGPTQIPRELINQLKIGGKMIVPAGENEQRLYFIEKHEDKIIEKELIPVRFVPMVQQN